MKNLLNNFGLELQCLTDKEITELRVAAHKDINLAERLVEDSNKEVARHVLRETLNKWENLQGMFRGGDGRANREALVRHAYSQMNSACELCHKYGECSTCPGYHICHIVFPLIVRKNPVEDFSYIHRQDMVNEALCAVDDIISYLERFLQFQLDKLDGEEESPTNEDPIVSGLPSEFPPMHPLSGPEIEEKLLRIKQLKREIFDVEYQADTCAFKIDEENVYLIRSNQSWTVDLDTIDRIWQDILDNNYTGTMQLYIAKGEEQQCLTLSRDNFALIRKVMAFVLER